MYANFERAWPGLKNKYGERFYRMWRFYLLSAAAGFAPGPISCGKS
jgi:cyclopropane-fatty-acyl-phospholipid synthase